MLTTHAGLFLCGTSRYYSNTPNPADMSLYFVFLSELTNAVDIPSIKSFMKQASHRLWKTLRLHVAENTVSQLF